VLFQSERRKFLKGIGLLGGLSLLPAAVVACAPKAETPPETPPEPLANHITVARTGGDFKKLSDALNQITDAAADNRYAISLYGRINEAVTIVARSYVDVTGFGADVVVNSGSNIPGADFNNVVDCAWRGVTLRRRGAVPDVTPCATFRGTTDSSCRIDQCNFLNQTSGGGTCHGISIFDAASPSGEFAGTGGAGGGHSMGIDIFGTAAPSGTFRGTGGSFTDAYPFCVGIRIGEDATLLAISEMGHYLYRTLWHNQVVFTSSLRSRL